MRHLIHRADRNHWQIMKDLKKVGFIVIDIHHGKLADLLVLAYGHWFVVEIKDEGKIDDLTPKQIETKRLMGQYVIYGETSAQIIGDIWVKSR